jgi:hypothetical protein
MEFTYAVDGYNDTSKRSRSKSVWMLFKYANEPDGYLQFSSSLSWVAN